MRDMRNSEKKRAAAIKYDPLNGAAPVMTAFGEGYLAERMIESAKDSGVPVVPDESLASMLAKLSVGDEIPPSLYEVVAKVLIFVSDMDKSYADKIKSAASRR